MTCIAAVKHKGKVVIGGDSAGVDRSLGLQLRADVKVFTRTDDNGVEWGFGFTSSFRMGQVLRYKLELPEVAPKKDVLEFMVERFVEAVRKAMREAGCMHKENEVEEGGNFLVGFKGELFEVQSDFQVAQPLHPFAACGCGADLALGALAASLVIEPDGEGTAHVERALRAAEQFSAGVRAPFHVVTVG